MTPAISFRPIAEDDLEFLQHVYASTRQDELAQLDWTPQQKERFLRMQFQAQHADYQRNYPDAQFQLILLAEQPIGRLYVHRRERELRVVDIALLPEHRGQGIGGRIMQDLLDEAAEAAKPVTIHVEQNNPALRLYRRLGFEKIGETGVYFLMERRPREG